MVHNKLLEDQIMESLAIVFMYGIHCTHKPSQVCIDFQGPIVIHLRFLVSLFTKETLPNVAQLPSHFKFELTGLVK